MRQALLIGFISLGALHAAENYCNWKYRTAIEPRVLRYGQPGTIRITATFDPKPSRVEAVLNIGGGPIPAQQVSPGVWVVEFPAQAAFKDYKQGVGHNLYGYLEEYDGANLAGRINLNANIRDDTMPDVAVRSVSGTAGQAQMTRHVLNLRDDNQYLFLTKNVPTDFVRRFYSYRGDDFDFLAFVADGIGGENRYYMGVRNDTRGIGADLMNQGAVYGSGSRLQGIVHFPNDNLFDLAEAALSHELGHRWCCFLRLPFLTNEIPHWPMGSIGYGMMGINVGGAGGTFPYELTAQDGNSYRARFTRYPDEFNDLELYLMGLLPAGRVPEYFVFQNQQQQVVNGTLQGPVTRFKVEDVIASAGQRSPGAGSAQTDFRLGTAVLSHGRLMSADEMAFYEHFAARGEARAPQGTSYAWMQSPVKPFYSATRGLATLSTVVCPECPGGLSAVSSASYLRGAGLAPDSIASSFGFGFGSTIQLAGGAPLPTVLADTSVMINSRTCPLFFISPEQINFVVPGDLPSGPAAIRVMQRGQAIAEGQVNIAPVSPALYTANANGSGVPAALAWFVPGIGPRSAPPVFQCGTSGCVPALLDLGGESDQLFLELYGTGIRNRTSLSAVRAQIGGVDAEVQYAGANGGFIGLDQVNVKVPRSLLHRGEVPLTLIVDGQPANPVTLRFR